MSSLEPRRGSGLSRRQREQRAYRLVVAGGVAGTIAVVSFVLAIVGVIGFGLPVIALVVAVICVILFRRLVGPSR
jgi:CHASE2 domain-containing sensor protein